VCFACDCLHSHWTGAALAIEKSLLGVKERESIVKHGGVPPYVTKRGEAQRLRLKAGVEWAGCKRAASGKHRTTPLPNIPLSFEIKFTGPDSIRKEGMTCDARWPRRAALLLALD
jgi:hypothetical protein